MRVDVALLVVGRGPAALVTAKVAGACGQPCLLAGHETVSDRTPVTLGPDAVAVLERHGLLDVLRPYLDGLDPVMLSGLVLEEVLKQHCVADVNVAVYDGVTVVDRATEGRGLRGVLTDGTSRWELSAEVFVDSAALPHSLPEAITAGAAAALDAISALNAESGGSGDVPRG